MLETRGNLWQLAQGSNLVLTTNGAVKANGECVMGRGIALEAKSMFPMVPKRLGTYINQYGNRCFNLGQWQYDGKTYRLISFPVKHKWFEDADITLIAQSCIQITDMANKFNWGTVWMPRPGCGNGKLDWDTLVRPVLANLLDNRFIVTTF
jgi:hypothetical protein